MEEATVIKYQLQRSVSSLQPPLRSPSMYAVCSDGGRFVMRSYILLCAQISNLAAVLVVLFLVVLFFVVRFFAIRLCAVRVFAVLSANCCVFAMGLSATMRLLIAVLVAVPALGVFSAAWSFIGLTVFLHMISRINFGMSAIRNGDEAVLTIKCEEVQ